MRSLERPPDCSSGSNHRNKGAPDGLFARCKDCTTEKRHRNMVEEPTVTHKVCRRCKIDKPATDFARNRSIKDGLYRCGCDVGLVVSFVACPWMLSSSLSP